MLQLITGLDIYRVQSKFTQVYTYPSPTHSWSVSDQLLKNKKRNTFSPFIFIYMFIGLFFDINGKWGKK